MAKLVQVGPVVHIVPVTIVAAEAAEAGDGIEEVAVERGSTPGYFRDIPPRNLSE